MVYPFVNSRSLSTVPIQLSSPLVEPVKCAQPGCIQKREMPSISRRVRSFPTLALSKSGYGSKFATSSQPMYKLPCSIYGSTIHDPPEFVKFWIVSFLHGSVGRGFEQGHWLPPVPCAGQEKIPVSQKMAAYSKRSCMSLRERTGRSVI